MSDYLPPAWDANGDSDDEVVTAAERSEPRDPRQRRPLDILIRRETAVIRMVVVEARSTFHRSPLGGSYHDSREHDRREQAEAAARAREETREERRAAMMAGNRRP